MVVNLTSIRKDVLKYYHEVANVWVTHDYHCVYVTFYNEDHIVSQEYTFYSLEDYLNEQNEEWYHSVEVKFDLITIKFPNMCID